MLVESDGDIVSGQRRPLANDSGKYKIRRLLIFIADFPKSRKRIAKSIGDFTSGVGRA
jgi:hypothetical protein